MAYQHHSKSQGSARPSRCDHLAVFDHLPARQRLRQFLVHAEMCGVPLVGQQSRIRQHRRTRADRGNRFAAVGKQTRQSRRSTVRPQFFHTRTARNKEQIELLRGDVRERHIRPQRDPAATRHLQIAGDGCDDHLRAGPAQEVNRSDRFDLFKTWPDETQDSFIHNA